MIQSTAVCFYLVNYSVYIVAGWQIVYTQKNHVFVFAVR